MTFKLKNTNSNASLTMIAFGILVLTIIVILWPLAMIWSVNTLFGTSIPCTFWTWLAGEVLLITFQGTRISNK